MYNSKPRRVYNLPAAICIASRNKFTLLGFIMKWGYFVSDVFVRFLSACGVSLNDTGEPGFKSFEMSENVQLWVFMFWV